MFDLDDFELSTEEIESTDADVCASVEDHDPVPAPGSRKRTREPTFTATKFEDLYSLRKTVLGKGAYAEVRLCESIVTGQEYAVKIINKKGFNRRSRAVKEIETFHLCSGHPNIVQLVEFFEEKDTFYLVMEKMAGGPLLDHITRKVFFTEHEASVVIKQIASALKHLHDQGIAHRDLKPENVLCTSPDIMTPVKLCDLDLASKVNAMVAESIKTPELQSPVGSAEFMAPEVVDAFIGDSLKYDKRCDLWSLGVILYILLCGYPPFAGSCWRQDCGWNRGESCQDCQDSLFAAIQQGDFCFDAQDWDHVSDNAKHLIVHLLVKDVRYRYSADDVLAHPWIVEEVPRTPLQTPDVLLRNDSARDLAQMQGNFNAATQMVFQNRISMERALHGTSAANVVRAAAAAYRSRGSRCGLTNGPARFYTPPEPLQAGQPPLSTMTTGGGVRTNDVTSAYGDVMSRHGSTCQVVANMEDKRRLSRTAAGDESVPVQV